MCGFTFQFLLFLLIFSSIRHAFVDPEGRICTVLAGRPRDDETWNEAMKKAAESMANGRTTGQQSGAFPNNEETHRRGRFFNVAAGVSFGGGQSVSALKK